MSWFVYFLSAMIYIVFNQNLVFSGGYGSSEAVRYAARPRQIVLFAVMITFFSTVTSLSCRLIGLISYFKTANSVINIALYTVVLFLVYIIAALIIKGMLKSSGWKKEDKEKLMRQVGVAAFNTIVLAVPFINQKVAYTVTESIGAGIGAGLAFILATLLINVGLNKIEENESIPQAFKGTPALFIYIAILSMAFSGFEGKSLFF